MSTSTLIFLDEPTLPLATNGILLMDVYFATLTGILFGRIFLRRFL